MVGQEHAGRDVSISVGIAQPYGQQGTHVGPAQQEEERVQGQGEVDRGDVDGDEHHALVRGGVLHSTGIRISIERKRSQVRVTVRDSIHGIVLCVGLCNCSCLPACTRW